ncbi:MAG: phosphoribosylanthranilate isomerase [Saprospiraceae bacterium]
MNNVLKIKVCGNQNQNNTLDVIKLNPDMMGFIFFKPSSRYCNPNDLDIYINAVDSDILKIGVFVNESVENVLQITKQLNLDIIQLHGDETVDYCTQIDLNTEAKIIKVFRIDDRFNFDQTALFLEVCDYYLFDTKTIKYGGSGKKFNWQTLNQYTAQKPFILSGGITPNDLNKILDINHNQLIGIDINSGFESCPGIKDIDKLSKFISEIRKQHEL